MVEHFSTNDKALQKLIKIDCTTLLIAFNKKTTSWPRRAASSALLPPYKHPTSFTLKIQTKGLRHRHSFGLSTNAAHTISANSWRRERFLGPNLFGGKREIYRTLLAWPTPPLLVGGPGCVLGIFVGFKFSGNETRHIHTNRNSS